MISLITSSTTDFWSRNCQRLQQIQYTLKQLWISI